MAERSTIERFARDVVGALGMGLMDREVRIGIVRDNAVRHDGILHVRHAAGRIKTVKFLVDKPQYLKRPTELCVQSIFKQGQALGMEVLQVELIWGNRHRMYTAGNPEPAFMQVRFT